MRLGTLLCVYLCVCVLEADSKKQLRQSSNEDLTFRCVYFEEFFFLLSVSGGRFG